ncbi:MAG: hypothetical protein WCR46_10085 [Deltaproteobacteria bacterium]
MEPEQVNQIIHHYPYPIAIPYRIVAGMVLEEEPEKSLKYILDTAEAVARLLGFISLSELIRQKEGIGIDIPNGVKNDFKKNIQRPSFGIWNGMAREGFQYQKQQNLEIVIPDMKQLYYEGRNNETDFKIAMDRLIKLRNMIAHKELILDTTEKQQSAVRISRRDMNALLTRLSLFDQVSFGYIQSIEVTKKPRQQAMFHHKGKKLKGDSVGKGINLSMALENIKETDSVMIRYDRQHYLSLYPFYIYDESSGDAADVFYYNGKDNKGRLVYIGIDHGGKFYVENRESQPQEILDDIGMEFNLLIGGGDRKNKTENIKCSQELHEEFDHIVELLN